MEENKLQAEVILKNLIEHFLSHPHSECTTTEIEQLKRIANLIGQDHTKVINSFGDFVKRTYLWSYHKNQVDADLRERIEIKHRSLPDNPVDEIHLLEDRFHAAGVPKLIFNAQNALCQELGLKMTSIQAMESIERDISRRRKGLLFGINAARAKLGLPRARFADYKGSNAPGVPSRFFSKRRVRPL